jgi:hypothetical protein
MLQWYQKKSQVIECPVCMWQQKPETLEQYVVSPMMSDTWAAIPNGEPEYGGELAAVNAFIPGAMEDLAEEFLDRDIDFGLTVMCNIVIVPDGAVGIPVVVLVSHAGLGELHFLVDHLVVDPNSTWKQLLGFITFSYGVMSDVTPKFLSVIPTADTLLSALATPIEITATLLDIDDANEWILDYVARCGVFWPGFITYFVMLPDFSVGFMGYLCFGWFEQYMEFAKRPFRMVREGVEHGTITDDRLFELMPFVIEAIAEPADVPADILAAFAALASPVRDEA